MELGFAHVYKRTCAELGTPALSCVINGLSEKATSAPAEGQPAPLFVPKPITIINVSPAPYIPADSDISSLNAAVAAFGGPISLKLTRCCLSDESIESLSEILPTARQLRSLEISWNNAVPRKTAQSLEGEAAAAVEAEEAVEGSQELVEEEQEPKPCPFATSLLVAPALNYLRSLSLRDCGLRDNAATALAKSLESTARLLSVVDLFQNQITNMGATSLFSALRINRRVKILNLGRNLLDDASCSALSQSLLPVTVSDVEYDELKTRAAAYYPMSAAAAAAAAAPPAKPAKGAPVAPPPPANEWEAAVVRQPNANTIPANKGLHTIVLSSNSQITSEGAKVLIALLQGRESGLKIVHLDGSLPSLTSEVKAELTAAVSAVNSEA